MNSRVSDKPLNGNGENVLDMEQDKKSLGIIHFFSQFTMSEDDASSVSSGESVSRQSNSSSTSESSSSSSPHDQSSSDQSSSNESSSSDEVEDICAICQLPVSELECEYCFMCYRCSECAYGICSTDKCMPITKRQKH